MTLDRPEKSRGWPARYFSEDSRDFLFSEARSRIQEQMRFMDSQDVRVATAFTISFALVSVTGVVGQIEFSKEPVAIATLIALFSSLVQWTLCWWAYRARTVESGINVLQLVRSYAGYEERDLKDTSLEVLVQDFADNQAIIDDRSRILSQALWALAIQLALLVITVCLKALAVSESATSTP